MDTHPPTTLDPGVNYRPASFFRLEVDIIKPFAIVISRNSVWVALANPGTRSRDSVKLADINETLLRAQWRVHGIQEQL